MSEYHLPVMLEQSVNGLQIKPEGTYVDLTFGGGGHSREILKQMQGGRLFVFDQDLSVVDNIPEDKRITFIHSNFRFLKQFARYYDFLNANGILADLGVSSHHFDTSERGFSFRFNARLDMRMNKASGLSAFEVVNSYDENRLSDLFYYYGEVRNARLLARKIVDKRKHVQIETTGALSEIAESCVKGKKINQYLSQVFQAIRIEVNHEMDTLKQMLIQANEVLKPGGVLSVITYHSLEDRLVKNFMKTGTFDGRQEKDFYGNMITPFELVNRKVIVPGPEEILQNPRARSAKLRMARKKNRDELVQE